MRYEVKWQSLWRSLTRFMALSILLTVAGVMILRYLSSGFNFAETFKHLSAAGWLGLIVGCWAFSAIFALLVSVWFKLAHITIADNVIHGRNYWGRKTSFHLKELVSIDSFSESGINAVVANGGAFGKIFIYHQTERIEEIIRILWAHLPSQTNAA